MKSRYLFAHKYKPLGWFLFLIGIALGIIYTAGGEELMKIEMKVFPLISDGEIFSNKSLEWTSQNIIDEIISILIIVGGIIVAFSKTKNEDEYITIIRMESLIWATYVNYTVLIIAVLFVFDFTFLHVMIYNMFTILLFFIIRFHYILFKVTKVVEDE